ncbi:MAG: sigma-70 family RNA polymerase sigma factor, partial [Chitinophagaceae bacterium]
VIESPQFKFYLLTATRNSCISFLRKQAGKVFVEPDDVNMLSVAETPEPASTGGPTQDMAAVVEKALSLLPPQCLAVFRLSRFGKLTYQQIAEELGISIKTVENQMGKALKIMRDYARRNNISFVLLLAYLDVCSALIYAI